MEFEDILKDVGGSGLYQKLLLLFFVIPVFTVIPWFSSNIIFINNSPDHWCYVPEVADSNLSLTDQLSLIRAPEDGNCFTYDVNFTTILQSENVTANTSWPTKACDQGWQFDHTNYDATSVTKWKMICEDSNYASFAISVLFIGNIIGTPVYGFMSDKWGRKPTFVAMLLITTITDIVSVFSPYFTLYFILRGINGSTLSTVYSTAYMIALEMVSPSMRTVMNGAATTAWTAGLCILPFLAYFTRNFIYLSIVTSSTAAVFMLYYIVIPESPCWLISQGKYEEAAKIMAKISEKNGKKAHEGKELLEKIKEFGEFQKKKRESETKVSPLDLIRYPTLRKRFILITLCWMGNGIPYAGLQMNAMNLAGNEFVNFFLMSLIEFPAHIVAWLFMEKVGRRWCNVGSFAITSIACAMPAILTHDPWVGVAASLVGKIGSSSSFMTLYQQAPELLPTTLRGMGLGLATTFGNGINLVVPFIVALNKHGAFLPFFIFAIISFVSCILASFLPETLHKKLPQTAEDVENFGRDQKYCSCRVGDAEDEVDKSVDLSSTIQDAENGVALKKLKSIPQSEIDCSSSL